MNGQGKNVIDCKAGFTPLLSGMRPSNKILHQSEVPPGGSTGNAGSRTTQVAVCGG